ncbi:MAG: hypothetical protein WCP31_03485 [Chloroflexales bacterium]
MQRSDAKPQSRKAHVVQSRVSMVKLEAPLLYHAEHYNKIAHAPQRHKGHKDIEPVSLVFVRFVPLWCDHEAMSRWSTKQLDSATKLQSAI